MTSEKKEEIESVEKEAEKVESSPEAKIEEGKTEIPSQQQGFGMYDIFRYTKLLEELGKNGKLSVIDVDYIQESYDKGVAMIAAHQENVKQQSLAIKEKDEAAEAAATPDNPDKQQIESEKAADDATTIAAAGAIS